MPTQYPYPERGWSTGNMRMAKAGPMRDTGREFRELEGERKKKETKASEYPALTPDQWANWQQQFPQGQMVDANHPELEAIGKTHDLYTIPNQYEKFLFMNPKQTEAG